MEIDRHHSPYLVGVSVFDRRMHAIPEVQLVQHIVQLAIDSGLAESERGREAIQLSSCPGQCQVVDARFGTTDCSHHSRLLVRLVIFRPTRAEEICEEASVV